MSYLVVLLASFLAVIIVVTTHEYAHAFVANKCGDPTPRLYNRLSLNPLNHFDPIGILAFAIVGFGWAKPVPINPYNFKNYKWGSFWTSAAGIIINFISAFLFYPLYILVSIYVVPLVSATYAAIFLSQFTKLLFVYSLSFCVFNLLPLYPLDGFRLLEVLSRKRRKVYQFLSSYGYQILIGLVLLSFLSERVAILAPLNVLGYVLRFATDILGYPITTFWKFLFKLG